MHGAEPCRGTFRQRSAEAVGSLRAMGSANLHREKSERNPDNKPVMLVHSSNVNAAGAPVQ
jgi:hypothetical protein